MYNLLIYQQGGTLYLDEPFEAQPTAATITIRTLDNEVLSTEHSTLTDIEDETASVSNLVLMLPALNKNAKVIAPSATAGTIPTLTDPKLRLLIESGGRKQYVKVSEYYTSGANVTSFRIDNGLDFDLPVGATAKAIRVSYAVDWSAVTSEFVGRVKAEWKVTVGGIIQKVVQIYDVVKQVLKQPATWADVINRRPDIDNQMSEVKNKEALVTQAWEDLIQEMYTLGIRYNLVIQDGSTLLRDATVLQCIINLVIHHSLSIPLNYESQGDMYIENLRRSKNAILGGFTLPIDSNQNGSIETSEEQEGHRQVWLRSRLWRRGKN